MAQLLRAQCAVSCVPYPARVHCVLPAVRAWVAHGADGASPGRRKTLQEQCTQPAPRSLWLHASDMRQRQDRTHELHMKHPLCRSILFGFQSRRRSALKRSLGAQEGDAAGAALALAGRILAVLAAHAPRAAGGALHHQHPPGRGPRRAGADPERHHGALAQHVSPPPRARPALSRLDEVSASMAAPSSLQLAEDVRSDPETYALPCRAGQRIGERAPLKEQRQAKVPRTQTAMLMERDGLARAKRHLTQVLVPTAHLCYPSPCTAVRLLQHLLPDVSVPSKPRSKREALVRAAPSWLLRPDHHDLLSSKAIIGLESSGSYSRVAGPYWHLCSTVALGGTVTCAAHFSCIDQMEHRYEPHDADAEVGVRGATTYTGTHSGHFQLTEVHKASATQRALLRRLNRPGGAS